ncbi:MAG: hypothetical protein JWN46_1875, partial [Acidimicrobiales bacterium]|nr:hypothetical protein [Acidimicrobiales bacterium]
RFAARLIDTVFAAALVGIVLLVGPAGRPWARIFLIAIALIAYDTIFLSTLGATPGKLALRLRVVELDRVGPPRLVAAFRRSSVVAALAVTPVFGWAGLVLSTTLSPLRRGVADRAARTFVVRRDAPQPITTASLAAYADAEDQPRPSPLGPVASLEDRRRARLRRLGDAPLLVGAMTVLMLLTLLPMSALGVAVVGTLLWLPVFVVDETWRISRFGATAGHRQAGLVVRSIRTGEPPTPGRSLVRALVLGLTLYVPVLWPLLAISLVRMKSSGSGRALHDLAAGTVVVADPRVDPAEQRQRAMSLRLGKAV